MNACVKMTSGNDIVDQIAKLNLTGNVIPLSWFHTICYPSGKANLNAIVVLSDIVYWYRPKEIRDEYSGQIIGYKKRFREDKLQRNYQQISDMFGITKNQALAAIDALRDIGVISKEFRNLVVNGVRINNVMYINLNPERLIELTYPEEIQCLSVSNLNRTGIPLERDRVSILKETGIPLESDTNTEITTKITDKDYINPILSEKVPDTTSLDEVKEQLDYEALCSDYPYEIDKIDGLLNIIHDVLLLEDTERVKINRQKLPAYKVKERFQSLNMLDIQYVIDGINNSEKKVTNMRSYLIWTYVNTLDKKS